jgi:hypothetical protein
LLSACGCGRNAGPAIDGRLAIENVAKWRQLYCADHGGQPPADEAAFVAFIDRKLGERGEGVADDLLVSPRDGQRYVVRYGKEAAKLRESDVAVHEQQGAGGRVLVALESGRSREVEASELPGLLSPQSR